MFGPREIELSPSAPVALCTLADAKTALNIVGADQDAFITSLLVPAAEAVEQYCSRPIAERTVTERRESFDACSNVVLNYSGARNLSALTNNGNAQTLGDFRLSGAYGTVTRTDFCAFPAGHWVFTYQAGYAAGSVPAPIVQAAALYVAHLYNTAKGTLRASAGIVAESSPDVGSVEYADFEVRYLQRGGVSLPADIALMLAPYVREF